MVLQDVVAARGTPYGDGVIDVRGVSKRSVTKVPEIAVIFWVLKPKCDIQGETHVVASPSPPSSPGLVLDTELE